MIRKVHSPPKTERRFASPWIELSYLCGKVSYWWYVRGQKRTAERYVDRMKRVLGELPENDLAIVRQEGLALLYELRGEIGRAIVHRRREIKLMERLHKEAQSPRYDDSTRTYMLRGRDITVLRARQAIVASLAKRQTEPSMGGAGRNGRTSSPEK